VTDRLPCEVPGCNRTVGRAEIDPLDDEAICGKHWRLVPRALKRVHARHKREFRKFGFYPRPSAAARIWDRCLRIASE